MPVRMMQDRLVHVITVLVSLVAMKKHSILAQTEQTPGVVQMVDLVVRTKEIVIAVIILLIV